MSLFRNALTAARDPLLGLEYLRWTVGRAIGRPLFVHGAFDTRLAAATFADFRSTRGLGPGPAETIMIRNLSLSHPVFLDVGANVGVWTVALAAAQPGARVYAFEPDPSTFALLQSNVRLNRLSNVVEDQRALCDSTGVLSFQVTGKTSIFNRLEPVSHAEDLRHGRFTNARSIEVPTIVLDDFCREHTIDRVGFMKIDVEGAEMAVLLGAEGLLRDKAIDLIWMEVEPDNLTEMGHTLDELATLVDRVGYTFHLLRADGTPGPAVSVLRQRSNNMVLKPKLG